MKLKSMVFFALGGVLAILVCCPPSARSASSSDSTPFIALSAVSVPEIPAKAAELVGAAGDSARIQTGRDVLRAVSEIAKPGVLPYVVSAICKRNPEVAGSVVAGAIGLQPDETLIFEKSAICAASGQMEQIVFSAIGAAPAASADIALLAFRELPSASEAIRTGLGNARPDLELYLEEAEIKLGTNDYQGVVTQAVQMFNDAAKRRVK
jgi:hypothetical protein